MEEVPGIPLVQRYLRAQPVPAASKPGLAHEAAYRQGRSVEVQLFKDDVDYIWGDSVGQVDGKWFNEWRPAGPQNRLSKCPGCRLFAHGVNDKRWGRLRTDTETAVEEAISAHDPHLESCGRYSSRTRGRTQSTRE